MDGELPRCAGLAGAGRGRNGAQLSGRVVRGASRSRCGGIQDSEPGVLQARQRGTSWLRGESSGRRAERQRPPWWEDPRVTDGAKGQRLEPREARGRSGDAHHRALGAGEREGPPLRGVSSVKETGERPPAGWWGCGSVCTQRPPRARPGHVCCGVRPTHHGVSSGVPSLHPLGARRTSQS